MDGNILTALLALAGTALGSVSGILTANKLTNHRIKQLEISVEKHNCLGERMTDVENKAEHHEKEIDKIDGKREEQKKQLETNAKELSLISGKVTMLEKAVDNNQKEIDKTNMQIAAQQNHIDDQDNRLAAVSERITTVEQRTKSNTHRIDTLQTQHNAIHKTV